MNKNAIGFNDSRERQHNADTDSRDSCSRGRQHNADISHAIDTDRKALVEASTK